MFEDVSARSADGLPAARAPTWRRGSARADDVARRALTTCSARADARCAAAPSSLPGCSSQLNCPATAMVRPHSPANSKCAMLLSVLSEC